LERIGFERHLLLAEAFRMVTLREFSLDHRHVCTPLAIIARFLRDLRIFSLKQGRFRLKGRLVCLATLGKKKALFIRRDSRMIYAPG